MRGFGSLRDRYRPEAVVLYLPVFPYVVDNNKSTNKELVDTIHFDLPFPRLNTQCDVENHRISRYLMRPLLRPRHGLEPPNRRA